MFQGVLRRQPVGLRGAQDTHEEEDNRVWHTIELRRGGGDRPVVRSKMRMEVFSSALKTYVFVQTLAVQSAAQEMDCIRFEEAQFEPFPPDDSDSLADYISRGGRIKFDGKPFLFVLRA